MRDQTLFDENTFHGYGPYGYDMNELIATERAMRLRQWRGLVGKGGQSGSTTIPNSCVKLTSGLVSLITLHLRKHRFCEGHLGFVVASGHIADLVPTAAIARQRQIEVKREGPWSNQMQRWPPGLRLPNLAVVPVGTIFSTSSTSGPSSPYCGREPVCLSQGHLAK